MLLDNWTLKDQVSRGTEWGGGARTEMVWLIQGTFERHKCQSQCETLMGS